MALFRCKVLKQRFLVPRVSSTVVYYVHSHRQYTPSTAQAVQKFDVPAPGQMLTTESYMENRVKTKVTEALKNNVQGSEEMSSDLIASFRLDPFIGQSQLALLSLCYDTHKNFRASYCKSLDEKTTLDSQKIQLSSVSNYSSTNCYYKSKKSTVWTLYRHNQESIAKKSEVVNTVHKEDLCNKTNEKDTAKKSVEEKCDPLHLAVVFDFLREEIPLFFAKGHDYTLYHNNVTFVNGLLGIKCRGLRVYKMCLSSMRTACQLSMTDVTMEILKITKENKDCTIKVRWRVSGVPRFSMFRSRSKQDIDDKRYVDGFSVFDVGKDGLIHCHRLLKLMPSQSPQVDNNPLWALNTAAVISLLRQEKSFQLFARQRVEDIEEAIPLFGTS